jgi:uncharacterized protein YycO
MSLDKFFKKVYNAKNYNCANLVVDVWKELTGKDIEKDFTGFLLPPKERFTPKKLKSKFIKLSHPQNPCIAIMRGVTPTPHVGVYINKKIIHITENGVQFVPVNVATFGFSTVRYYTC